MIERELWLSNRLVELAIGVEKRFLSRRLTCMLRATADRGLGPANFSANFAAQANKSRARYFGCVVTVTMVFVCVYVVLLKSSCIATGTDPGPFSMKSY